MMENFSTDNPVGDCDGETTLRRKRHSWKQHRVQADHELYACDQCDKMFGKQSSLARHKYEHSGNNPSFSMISFVLIIILEIKNL